MADRTERLAQALYAYRNYLPEWPLGPKFAEAPAVVRQGYRRIAAQIDAHAADRDGEVEALCAELDAARDTITRVHAALAGATWRYAMVRAADIRAALTGAAEGPPLLDVITAAIVMHQYPPHEWPDGPPGEGEHDTARAEAEAIVRAITGAPEPAPEVPR